jgi:hypothetical protein
MRTLRLSFAAQPLGDGPGLLYVADRGNGRRAKQVDELLDRLFHRERHGIVVGLCGIVDVDCRVKHVF